MSFPATGPGGRRRESTLRKRVAIELLVLTVALSMLLGATIMLIWNSSMRRRLDKRLETIARQVSARVERDGLGAIAESPAFTDVLGEPVLVLVRGTDGMVLAASHPGLPPPEIAAGDRLGPEFGTVPAGDLTPALGNGPVRIVSRPDGHGRVVQVGIAMGPLLQTQGLLEMVFLVIIPLLTAGATLAAWMIAGRRLARLEQLAGLAAGLDPSKLNTRLEEVGGDDEITRLTRELNKMLARLETAFAAQENFISEVSHELKTPVSVLLLEAQILARSEPDEMVYAKFVASVEDEMRRLSKLVESFLTLARAKHGDAKLVQASVDVNDAAVEAGQHCWMYARMRDIRLSVNLASEERTPEPPVVIGDPELLRTMIENLVRNAIAVSPRNNVVDLSVDRQDHRVSVRVRDRGPGVPGELAPRMFERFVTADHAKKGIKGSGLGLAIARGIAGMHGGDVQFRNIPPVEGGGAEFTVTIPVGRPGTGGAGAAMRR